MGSPGSRCLGSSLCASGQTAPTLVRVIRCNAEEQLSVQEPLFLGRGGGLALQDQALAVHPSLVFILASPLLVVAFGMSSQGPEP